LFANIPRNLAEQIEAGDAVVIAANPSQPYA
jgi:hypothetical protein